MSLEQVKADLDALFVRMGLATSKNNRGLGLILNSKKDAWQGKLMGHAIAYEQRNVSGENFTVISESRTFFSAKEQNGKLHVSNFTTSDFSALTDWWQSRLAPGVRPVDSLEDIEAAYTVLVGLLDEQLAHLGKAVSVDNRIYLLNLTMAKKQARLPILGRDQFSEEVADLALPLLPWWEAGVGVEYTLHFFNPYAAGGFIKSGKSLFSKTTLDGENRPALTIEQALQAEGVPISKLRLLYPTGAERF